ncbi:hypothetical protein C1Y63_09540 [Corynebacterium sp. 13CS0277]|uniref:LpqB family beta-propeller domain-containing protein n=1 Tax=Corynebacterium sp. 13CS0277 TaxID=2071994 RepID=UPI000D042912|nr:LpqB family beta-propeller domain-containing protein [Corynebacterium sp. 13CS0277]PRQ10782.1 hypothetical protein C1Y63_09540 [Corynebacterium sp. 13CS0277]
MHTRWRTRPGKVATWVMVAGMLAGGGVLTACTSLPGDGSPQVLRSWEPAVPTEEDNAGPIDGQEPDLLLRSFFAALGRPTGSHQAARAYLTQAMAEAWNDGDGATIVDRIDITTTAMRGNNRVTFTARGSVVGSLGTGGAYRPAEGELEATIDMVKVDGQWRIDALPQGVLLERTELQNNFSPQNLFFFDSTGRFLVRDRRWVYTRQPQLDTALISLLMEGPTGLLGPGVETVVPPGGTFTGISDGAYMFTGFNDLKPDDRHKFAAQVIWTLAKGGITGPYRIELDGAPIDPDHVDMDVDDVAEYNPSAPQAAVAPLYTLLDGNLFKLEGDRILPLNTVDSTFTTGMLTSAAVSVSGEQPLAAAVALEPGSGEEGDRFELLVGPTDGAPSVVMDGATLTRPSFEYGGTALWTVADGRDVVRIARSTATGDMTQQAVEMPDLDDDPMADTPISDLMLSPTGVRAAMIRDGVVYLGTVARPGPGERRIVNVIPAAPAIGNTAISLDWMRDGSLIVGTSDPDSPVWRVEPDGSGATPLPSGNITAPVVEVATSATMLYLTDARATLQLPVNAGATAFWREVPALVGSGGYLIVGS